MAADARACVTSGIGGISGINGSEVSRSSVILGSVAVSLGLSCLILRRQAKQAPDEASSQGATSKYDARRNWHLDAQDEVADDARRLQWRSSADRRQGASTPMSANSPTSTVSAPVDGVFGVDIGGTLAKLVFLEKVDSDADSSDCQGAEKRKTNFITARERFGTTGKRHTDLQFPCERLGGVLHFIKFETRRLDNALKIVRESGLTAGMERVYMSGGGAFMYEDKIETELGLKSVPVDEFEALVSGIDYVLAHGPPDEVYSMVQRQVTSEDEMFQRQEILRGRRSSIKRMIDDEVLIHPSECLCQPYMVVNIGSGVSFLKVRPLSQMGPTDDGSAGTFPRFERCGGTAMGGATFWGMARLITDATTFEEAMELCRAGDSDRVDKLVMDIYGGDYTKVGLKGEVTASSFGKLSSMEDPKREARQEDLCLALLKMITAQITNLAANIARLHGVSRVFFVGGFLRFNEISRPQIAHFCERFFNIQALFLRHADFLGALGALDEASRDLGLSVEHTRTKGRSDTPRMSARRATSPPPVTLSAASDGASGGTEVDSTAARGAPQLNT